MKDTISNWKKSNDSFRWVMDESAFAIQQIYSFMTGQRIEPRHLPWFYSIGLEPSKLLGQTHSLIEYRHSFFTQDWFKYLSEDWIKDYLTVIGGKAGVQWVSPLFIMKGNTGERPIYIVRRCPLDKSDLSFSFLSTKNHPILVEYTHPEMEESIEFDMEDGWWIIGNELFSPSFVLRCLEYQSTSFYFDEDYKIRIMDHNFNIIEIGSDTYIEITKDGFEWKKEPIFDYDGDMDTDTDTCEDTCDETPLIRS